MWSFCAVALAARLAVFGVTVRRNPSLAFQQDSGGYLTSAVSLSRGQGYSDGQGRPVFWWPPGYSLFLAGIFAARIASPEHPVGVVLIQILLGSLVVVIACRLAFVLGGRGVAIGAGVLMSLEPSSIAHSHFIMTETVFTFTAVTALWTWWSWWARPRVISLVLLSLLIGFLPLIRPSSLYLPLPLALILLVLGRRAGRRTAPALILLLGSLLPSALWCYRNFRLLGVPELALVVQFNKARFAHDVRLLAGEKTPESPYRQPWQEGYGADQGLAVHELVHLRNQYFLETIGSYPWPTLERLARTGVLILGVPDSKLYQLFTGKPPDYRGGSITERAYWLMSLGWLGVFLVLGMAISLGGVAALPVLVFGCRHWDLPRKALLAWIATFAVFLVATASSVKYQAERFRVPVMPALAVMLAVAVGGPRSLKRERGDFSAG